MTAMALPLVSAHPAVASAKAKDCLAGTWEDEEGNEYEFKGSSGPCASSYKIEGKLTFSTEFKGLPWKVKGSGTGTSFAFEVYASQVGSADGFCSYVEHGTVSGSPPSESASGTYSNLSPCSGGGIFYMVQESAGPVNR